MSGFLVALLIILILFIFISISSAKSSILNEINALSKKVDKLKVEIHELQTRKEVIEVKKPETAFRPENTLIKQAAPPPLPPKAEVNPEIDKTAEKPQGVRPSIPVYSTQKPPIPKREAPKQRINYEKFIGENLINKIGIGILVLGIGIFVKYAIDQEWINENGRVLIGILCGGILLGIAHYLRKSYKAFSSVLLGGGIATLYFTIYIAFRFYEIFGQSTAFSLMVVITAFTVAFSLIYNRIEIAILGILGGFLSPFLVSQGDGNHIILFSYLLILNVGMLVLCYFKKWPAINILCYIFTALIYGSWLFRFGLNPEEPHYISGFLFATLFFLTFFLMNLLNNLKEQRKFTATDFSLILSDAALYYTAGFVIIEKATDGLFTGLFTASLACFFFIFSWVLFRIKRVEKNLLYLLTGLVLTFLSLTAPVQLSGNHITLFWAAESVLLLWLFQKSGIKIIRTGSLLVLTLMLISLGMDWFNLYQIESGRVLSPIFNKVFITSVFSFASVFLYNFLVKKEELTAGIKLIEGIDLRPLLKGIMFPLSYIPIFLELYHQMTNSGHSDAFIALTLHAFTGIYLITVYMIEKWQKSRISPLVFSTASLIYFLWYILMHYTFISIRNEFATEGTSGIAFTLHYVNAFLMILLLNINYRILKAPLKAQKIPVGYYIIPALILLLYVLSAELDHLMVLSLFTEGELITPIIINSHKVGYPILWGLFSFSVMIIGMKKKMKDLRIAALALIFITLIKLAVYDIRDISEGGKIAAFICLGILLLTVSFLYQKLKVLLLEDTEKEI